jgi:hypothetical protein
LRISQKIRDRNLEASRQKAAEAQKAAQAEYDAYINSPEGQQALRYQEYLKKIEAAKQAQADLKRNLLAEGYTTQESGDIITLSAPTQTVTKTHRGEVIDSRTFSPSVFQFKGDMLLSQESYTGYTYKDAAHVALTFSKSLEDANLFTYREKRYDIEGYSTDLRSETVIDILGNVYSKEMWRPKDYDNKYNPEYIDAEGKQPNKLNPPTPIKPENYNNWNAAQKAAWLKSQNDKGKFTQEQLNLAKSLTNQEQMKRYGRVITPTTNETKTTYSFITDKNKKQDITRKQYKAIEKKNKEITPENINRCLERYSTNVLKFWMDHYSKK